MQSRACGSGGRAGGGSGGNAGAGVSDGAGRRAGGSTDVDRQIASVVLDPEQLERWADIGKTGSEMADVASKTLECVKAVSEVTSAAAKIAEVVVPFCAFGGALLDLIVAHLETVAENEKMARKVKSRLEPWKQVLSELLMLKLPGAEAHYRQMLLAMIEIEKTAHKWVRPRYMPRIVLPDHRNFQLLATKYKKRFDEQYVAFEEARKVLMMSLAQQGLVKAEDIERQVEQGLLNQEEMADMLRTIQASLQRIEEEQNRGRDRIATDAVVNNLRELPAMLIGRERDLACVEAALGKISGLASAVGHATLRKSTVGKAAIIGDAGMGKSTLATMAAYAALGRAESSGTARHLIGFIRAETVGTLIASYSELLRTKFGWMDDEIKNKKAREMADALMDELRNGGFVSWLLVIDNVSKTGYGGADLGFKGLEPHFFSNDSLAGMAGKGSFVFTCRTAVFFDSRDVWIEPLGIEDGARLLLGELYDSANEQDRAIAKELAEDLGGLPLALATSRDLLAKKNKSGYSIRQLKERLKKEPGGEVDEALALPLDYVRSTSPGAAAALDIAAFLSPDGIPLRMLLVSSDAGVVIDRDDVDLLVELGLLRLSMSARVDRPLLNNLQGASNEQDGKNKERQNSAGNGEPEYSMHRLLQAAARKNRSEWRALASFGAEVCGDGLAHEVARNRWSPRENAEVQGLALVAALRDMDKGFDDTISVMEVERARGMIKLWGLEVDHDAAAQRIEHKLGKLNDSVVLFIVLAVVLKANAPTIQKFRCEVSSSDARETPFAAIGAALGANTTLQSLDLSDNYIRADGAAAIGKGLGSNTALQSLDLYNNFIGDKGAAAIVTGLGANTVLQSLGLSNNNIGAEGAVAIGKGLGSNTTLKPLDLSYWEVFPGRPDVNNIGPEGAAAIVKGLRATTALQSLHLAGNNIGPEGAAAIVKGFGASTTLQSLDLERNSIGAEGATTIVKGFRANRALQSLDLNKNSIGDEGAAVIGDYLGANTALQNLDLACNDIGDEGTAVIGKGLGANTALEALSLWWNKIGDEGAAAIGKGLGTNTTLQSLNLWANSIGAEGAVAIGKGLGSNTALQSLDLS